MYPVILFSLATFVFIYNRRKSSLVRLLKMHSIDSIHRNKVAYICDVVFKQYRSCMLYYSSYTFIRALNLSNKRFDRYIEKAISKLLGYAWIISFTMHVMASKV